MRHLGDITKINGAEIPPVEVIVGGSPCQDLSQAGTQRGILHSDLGDGETTRSGLFIEQVRIAKEMRANDKRNGRSDDDCRPYAIIWENVGGALHSNSGRDFREVLEQLVRVRQPDASIPMPAKGKWSKAGYIEFDGGSLAWRLLDGQYWGRAIFDDSGRMVYGGTPQRRKRISLIVCYRESMCAGEILFEHKGLLGPDRPRTTPWKALSRDTFYCTSGHDGVLEREEPVVLQSNQNNAQITQTGICNTLVASGGMGGGYVPMITEAVALEGNGQREPHHGDGYSKTGDPMFTLNTTEVHAVAYAIGNGQSQAACNISEEILHTLDCMHDQQAIIHPVTYDARGNGDGEVCGTMTGDHETRITDYTNLIAEPHPIGIDRAGVGQGRNAKYDFQLDDDLMSTLIGTGPNSVAAPIGADLYNGAVTGDVAQTVTTKTGRYADASGPSVIQRRVRWIVRRITCEEAERLQGFPTGWTDIGDWVDSKGKKHKGDSLSPRYKSLGNSICIPQWFWLFQRMKMYLPERPTLGSLFDGIGGFPLAWEGIYGKGTAVWASEIEEFPIAVTKIRFPEEQ